MSLLLPAPSDPRAPPATDERSPVKARADLTSLLEVWRGCLGQSTRDAYLADLIDYARSVGATGPAEAVEALLRAGKVAAEQWVLGYLRELGEVRGLSPATVARRRMALRSVVRVANGLGLVEWVLSAPMPRSSRPRSYRDTRGPGLAAVRLLRGAAAAQGGPKGLRDVALIGMLYSLGLRRAEVCGLNIADYDRAGRKLRVVGKGRSDADPITVPEPLAQELDTYLEARGWPAQGPLFSSVDPARKGSGRLSPSGVYKVLKHLARRAGVTAAVSPHRLRHSAITDALDGTRGDVRRVRHFSRHSKLETVLVYDDSRRDDAGEVATMLAAALGAPRQAAAGQIEEETAEADVDQNVHYGELEIEPE